jgi:hypothetical protein
LNELENLEDIDINIKQEFLKLVQKKAGNTLEAIGIGKDFLSRTQGLSR